MFLRFKNSFKGVGLNLRLELIDEVLRQKPKIEYLEIIADNWLSTGPHHQKLEELRKDYKILFHCVGMNIGGTDELNTNYLTEIKKLKEKYSPEHISDHLCFQAHNKHHFHDLLPIPYSMNSQVNIIERVKQVQDFFDEEILLENLSYYIEYSYSVQTESFFLNQLRKATGCYFLLDINNILTNQHNLGISAKQFLKEIDKDGIKEIHMAGSTRSDDLFIDTHGAAPSKAAYKILKDLKLNVPVIYERDMNIENLNKTMKIVKKISKAHYV